MSADSGSALHAWPLDQDIGVGVHAGQKPAAGVGQVDLASERAALDVDAHDVRRDGTGDRLVAERLTSTVAFEPMWM